MQGIAHQPQIPNNVTAQFNKDIDINDFRHLQERLSQMVSDVEVEIQTLKHSRLPVLPALPTSSTATIELVSEFRNITNKFFKEKISPRILELEQERQRLAATYNALLPVHRLSAEALSSIFLFATLKPVDKRGSWLQCHWPFWSMNLSHVCQIWRTLAVTCPGLWSTSYLSYPELSAAYLSRGMDSPMTVIWEGRGQDWGAKQDSLLLQILSQGVGRVRHFISRNHVPLLDTSILWADQCKSDALALETLVVTDPGEGHQAIFHQGLPNLRHLDINRCQILWPYLPLSATLTHLDIRSQGGYNRAEPFHFLYSLVSLWNLQSLHLCENLPELRSLPATIPPLPLPSLQFLSLMDGASYITDFLSLVRTYIAADVHIYCTDEASDESQSLSALTRLIDKIFTSTRNVYGAERNVETLRLFSTGADINYHSDNIKFPAHPNLTIADDCSENTAFELLEILMSHLNFSTLTSLVIDDESGLPFEMPWLFFGRLPKLRTITMHHTLDLTLIEALGRDSRGLFFSDESGISFPALTSLEFVDLDEDYELDMEECTCRLIRMLTMRSKARFPLSVLHIEESACFEPEHIDEIRRAVSSVTVLWDGWHVCIDRCISCGDPKIVEQYAQLEI